MPRFPSLTEQPHLADVFKRFPRGMMPLMEFHDVVLRGDSPFSAAERELIAAYTSGLNACNFCFGSHQIIAEIHGIEPQVFDKLINAPAEAGLEDKWLPLLDYVKKLTEAPARLTDADADAVYAAGWSEEALFDAITVCALFNFMNRIVEGSGVVHTEESRAVSRERHASIKDSKTPYSEFGKMINVGDA